MNRLSRILLVLAAVLLAGAADTRTLYKYLGADGKTVYSDKPPAPGIKFEKIEVDTSKSGFDPRQQNATTPAPAVDAYLRERKAKEAEQDDKVADLQQAYDAAVAALEANKEPREGERNQNVNGTSRLNDNYFNRVAQLQKNVDDAKAKLDAARSNR